MRLLARALFVRYSSHGIPYRGSTLVRARVRVSLDFRLEFGLIDPEHDYSGVTLCMHGLNPPP